MSATWKILRENVVVADLATTDTNIEALQVLPVSPPAFASPGKVAEHTSDLVNEIAVMVLAYDGVLAIVSTTVTLQVIEESPPPQDGTTSEGAKLYIGRAPVTLHPTGRIHVFDARYVHRFTVRLSAAAAGTTLKVFWRPLR